MGSLSLWGTKIGNRIGSQAFQFLGSFSIFQLSCVEVYQELQDLFATSFSLELANGERGHSTL